MESRKDNSLSSIALDHLSYDPQHFALLRRAEDRHFWFRARNHILGSLVGQITLDFDDGFRVLEIGCGTGNVLRVLEQSCGRGRVTGMDLFWEGLQWARKRTSCSLIQGDLLKPPFKTQFHLVGLFDVLEHMPDDDTVLKKIHEYLMPGGKLLITVPAYQSLWSNLDQASYHYRRYDSKGLTHKLISAGYRLEYVTYYMACLFPLLWVRRKLMRRRNRTSDKVDPLEREIRLIPGVNELLFSLLIRETPLILRRCRLPFGASLLAVASKEPKPLS